jgi:hypothetical protein
VRQLAGSVRGEGGGRVADGQIDSATWCSMGGVTQ